MINIRKTAMTAIFATIAAAAAAEPPPIRLAYNYCTLSYTFAFYSNEEWAGEIDRLAKAGYNVALVTDGTFKVWQMTLRDLGYPEEDILAFIPDECARAWWLMGNLTGEGGPLDQKTIDEDGARGRFICETMREKGIEPILQGFTGMMPLGYPTALPQGKWSCYERPPILDPTGAKYAEIAEIWYKNLEKVYGFKPKFLAGDLFHEGGKTAGVDVTAATRAVQAAQQRAFPGVTWVVQAWQQNPTSEVRAGLDPRFTLIEALVKDMSSEPKPMDYGDLPWIWCEVLNFGGNHGLYGNLKTFSHLGLAAQSQTFRGFGLLSEGLFTNPVCYDLFEEMMMRPVGSVMTYVEFSAWLEGWIEKRYGTKDPRLVEAWQILVKTAYVCPRCQEGTVENVMCAEPSWEADNVSTWGPRGGLWYSTSELERAAELFRRAADDGKVRVSAAIKADLVDIERQVLANRARALAPQLKDSGCVREQFLLEMMVLGRLMARRPEFCMETYLDQANARAGRRGEKAFKRMVTTWADPKYGHTTLSDYANREYSELILDYYLPRWRRFLK